MTSGSRRLAKVPMSPALPRSSTFHVTIEIVCRRFAPSCSAETPLFAPPSFFAESTFLVPPRTSAWLAEVLAGLFADVSS